MVPVELIDRFLELQSRELRIRSEELAIKSQQDNNQKSIAEASISAQLKRPGQRARPSRA